MAKKAFEKFISKEIKGAKKKELIRQEKKKVRAETKAFFEEKKQQYKLERSQPGADAPKKNAGAQSGYSKRTGRGIKKSSTKYSDRDRHGYDRNTDPRSHAKNKPADRDFRDKKESDRKRETPYSKPSASKSYGAKSGSGSDKKPAEGLPKRHSTVKPDPQFKTPATEPAARPAKQLTVKKKGDEVKIPTSGKKKTTEEKSPEPKRPFTTTETLMPLNKFIAHAGICARRDAADLVRTGKVTVNDRHITEPGFKVMEKDDIRVNGQKITVKRPQVYILLNKPKDYLTTTDDPQGRKTVLDIVRNASAERVYPVGRLDRNTTGVLLLTNDGELAQKLSHPRYMVKKIYEVKLDKPLIRKDFDTIMKGVTLEDGFIAPDSLAYADAKDSSVIGIEIHSGKNRIVRRIFESLGYDVRNLDRVMYAGLTKKNVERGKWRMLSEKEVRLLKFMNSSYAKKQ